MATRRNTVSIDLDALPQHHILKLSSLAASARARLGGKDAAAEKGEPSLYSSPVFQGYSLWLMPSGESLTYLKEVIASLASDAGTESFIPHLTVLAAIKDKPVEWLLEKLSDYERRLSHNFDDIYVPILDLHGLGGRDLFFQSIYAHPVMTKSIQMVNKLACEVFEREGNGCGYDAAYMPHLSLVYGDLPLEEKTELMKTATKAVIGKKYSFGSLQLWDTNGEHTEWKCVKKVALPLPIHELTEGGSTSHADSSGDDEHRGLFHFGRLKMMQWAAARKALIHAHKRVTKVKKKKVVGEDRKMTVQGTESFSNSDSIKRAGRVDSNDSQGSDASRELVDIHEHEEPCIKKVTRHNRLMQELNTKNRESQQSTIQQHILEQLSADFKQHSSLNDDEGSGDEDGDDMHPVLEIIANYDFDGGISKAGMSWGKVGHAAKKTGRGIERRKSALM